MSTRLSMCLVLQANWHKSKLLVFENKKADDASSAFLFGRASVILSQLAQSCMIDMFAFTIKEPPPFIKITNNVTYMDK